MDFDLWPKISELPSKLPEAVLTALAVREILRQVDHSVHVTLQTVKRIRKRVALSKTLRKEAEILLDRGIIPPSAIITEAATMPYPVIREFGRAMEHVVARRRRQAILRRYLGVAG